MRNLSIYSLMFVTLLACQQEEEEVLLGRPEDRIDQMLKDYKQQLVTSPHGWKGYIFPGYSGGFSFLFEFSEEGRVTMMADINRDCATEAYESSFRMEMAQRPSLFFDTYSYLHILSDPSPDTIGGFVGQGLLSDFEFAFESTSGDTIRLKGNQNGTPLILIKAGAEEAEEYKSGLLFTRMIDVAQYNSTHPFIYLAADDGQRINTSVNLHDKKFTLSYKQADTLNVSTVPFAYTPKGIYLQEPVQYKSIEFQEVFYDEAKDLYYIEPGGVRTELKSSTEPILPLHLLVGIDFSVISFPTDPINGCSPSFLNTVDNIAFNLYAEGLGLATIEFDFNTENKTMNINVFFVAMSTGRIYVARYPYSYTKSSDGYFRFARYDEPNGNGKYLQPVMEPFFEPFDNHRFRMDYFKSGGEYVAQLKCIESPFFYFTGNFGSAF